MPYKLLVPIPGSYTTQGFGSNPSPGFYKPYKGHMGNDWHAKYVEGVASHDGKAVYGGSLNASGYGLYLKIVHPEGWYTIYGHLSKYLVANGSTVKAGQKAYVTGNSGYSTAPHLHHGLMPLNPNTGNGYGGYIDPGQYYTTNLGDLQNMSVRTELDKPALGKAKAMSFLEYEDTGEDINDYFNVLYGGKPLGDQPMTAFIDYMWKHPNRAKAMAEYRSQKDTIASLNAQVVDLKKQLANAGGSVDKPGIASLADQIKKKVGY